MKAWLFSPLQLHRLLLRSSARSDLRDFSKLTIRDGVIRYRLYQQDGSVVPMTVRDTYSNRLFVSWVQVHDRYSRRRNVNFMLHARWEAFKHIRGFFPRRGCRIWRLYSHLGLKTYAVFCECGKKFH